MPSDDPVSRWMFATDQHAPYHDRAATSVVLQAIGIVKPTGFIQGGDFCEAEFVSGYKWKKKRRPDLEYILPDILREIQRSNKYLDEYDEALDKAGVQHKEWCHGNHDERYDRFVEEYPYMGHLSFVNALKVKERGYKFHKIGKWLQKGALYFYHGHHHGGLYHTRNHLVKGGVNVMYGHWHDIQEHSITHIDGQKSAWSVGCLKSFKPEHGNMWLGRRAINWGHAFAVIDFWDNKKFTVHVVRIIGGKCSLWGEIIDGNKKKTTTS